MNLFFFATLFLSAVSMTQVCLPNLPIDFLTEKKVKEVSRISKPREIRKTGYSVDILATKKKKYVNESIGDAGHLILSSQDVDLFFGGRVRQEYFTGQRTITLSRGFPDSYNFFRHRAELMFGTRYGRETYGKAAVESGMKLISFFNWRFEDLYAPLENYNQLLQGQNKNNARISVPISHKHTRHIALIYPEELWLKTDFDVFIPALKNKEYSLKVGYFPYQVGRGISLGSAYEGGVGFMGFQRPSVGSFSGSTPPHSPFLAPGILFHGTLCPEVAYEFYYSKWRASVQIPWSSEIPQAKNLDMKVLGLYGKAKDSDELTAKVQFNFVPDKDTKFYIEPYYVYLNSPQHTVEGLYGGTVPGDSSISFNTFGCMFDAQWKGLSFNAELATQWGLQEMHSIERDVRTWNTVVTDGQIREQATSLYELEVDPTNAATYPTSPDIYAKGYSPNRTALSLYNDTGYATMSDDLVAELKRTSLQRSADLNGKPMKNPNSTVTTAGLMNSYFWPMADDSTKYRLIYPIGDWFVGEGKARYRPAYNVTLKGWMGLCDIGYEFEAVPVKISAAIGLISGDNYPYNEEVNKTYKGFLPLRDINYQGHLVKSVAIFTYRLMPRPLNIGTADILARSNIDDSSNIRFFGFGVDYAPLRDKKQLTLNANLAFFWEDADLYVWDKKGSIPVPAVPSGSASTDTWNAYAVARAKEDSRQAYVGSSASLDASYGLDLEGWQGTTRASKQLGTEINFQAVYRLTKNSDMIFRGGYFFPGQLYRDLEGQPNILTRTWIQNDAEVRRSLGKDYCYAWNLRIQYIF